jgi:hypothetical protein
MNPELGDSVPLRLIPDFLGVLEIEKDEETVCQEGPFKTDIEIVADEPDTRGDPDSFAVTIVFRNRHIGPTEPADFPADFRLLVRTRDQLRQLGTAIVSVANGIDAQ